MGTIIGLALRTVGTWVVAPFMALGPTLGLIVLSVVVTVFVLLIFRGTSDPRKLRTSKDQMQGALLGIVVFQHDTAVMFGEEWRLIRGALTYMLAGLKPLAAMIVPVMAVIAALGLYYSRSPLSAGKTSIVTIYGTPANGPALSGARLDGAPGVTVETAPLRIPSRGEVCWGIRGVQPGLHTLTVRVGDTSYAKSVVVGPNAKMLPLSAERVRGGFWATFAHTGEPALPDGAVDRISVEYPSAQWHLGPIGMHWLLAFLILTILVGLVLKGPLRVEL
jgi:hypothetical protein